MAHLKNYAHHEKPSVSDIDLLPVHRTKEKKEKNKSKIWVLTKLFRKILNI